MDPIKDKSWIRGRIVPFCLFVCVAANLLLFWAHYLGLSTFPWDFVLSYHSVPYFVVESVKLGVVPQWVSIQGMGYPLFLNLQSFALYPPFLALAWLGGTYTIYFATLLQCAHILFGGVGALAFFWRLKLDWRMCLLGAIGYQFFGGFLSNSEHPDIVRAFSFLPWIFAALVGRFPARDIFSLIILPWLICLLWLGGYPGTSISLSFLAGVFVLARLFVKEIGPRELLQYLFLLGLGVGMAIMWLLPGFIMREEIARISESSLVREFFSLKQLAALIQPIHRDTLKVDISMRSIYLGIPLFAGLFFLTKEEIRKYRVFVGTGILALLMGTGSSLYIALSKLLFPLGLSRFPVADYRAVLYLVILLFSVLGLDRFYKQKTVINWKKKVGLFSAFLVSYLIIADWVQDLPYFISGLIVIFLTLRLMSSYGNSRISSRKFLLLFCALIFFDALRVHVNRSYWVNHNGIAKHKAEFGDLKKPTEKLVKAIKGQESRPERSFEYRDHEGGFRGYLTGDFMVSDYSGPMQFKRQQSIIGNPTLLSFAESKWCAIVSSPTKSFDELLVNGCKEQKESGKVSLSWYGLNDETLKVTSSEAFDFVENELYFPGWRAEVIFADGKAGQILTPTEYKGFRHWHAPAGDYILKLRYHTPGLKAGLIVSSLFWSLWIAFVLFAIYRKRQRNLSNL